MGSNKTIDSLFHNSHLFTDTSFAVVASSVYLMCYILLSSIKHIKDPSIVKHVSGNESKL